jgi:hypothetical protein
MATNYAAPAVNTVNSSEDAGQLTFNAFDFDFAKSYAPAALGAGDKIQIGVVPAGEKLVPQLCRLDMLKIDTGTPTGDYSIGTEDAPTALKGSTASETSAAVLFGEDWSLATGAVGSADEPTPIYIVIINASDAVPTTGVIRFEQVSRPL